MTSTPLPLPQPNPAEFRARSGLLGEIRAVGQYRHLVRYLVSSDMRTEYAGTVLGYLWWLLDPFLTMAVYWALVGLLSRGQGIVAFPVYILSGLLTWFLFTKVVTGSMTSTLTAAQTMRQLAFPGIITPIVEAVGQLARFLVAIFVVLIVAGVFYGLYPGPELILAPFIAVSILMLSVGLGLLLSTLNFFLRDTLNISSYLFRLWYFLSPGIYDVSLVKQHVSPGVFRLYMLNPFATFFPAMRGSIMYSEWPNWADLGYVTLFSAGVLALGLWVFVRYEPRFAKLAL